VAAGAAAGAVWFSITALTADPEGPRRDVVVAATDAPAGHALGQRDLAVQSMPQALVPDGAGRDPRRWRGRVLTGPVRSGAVITDSDVSVSALARGQPEDSVVAYVGLASQALATAATPGTHVEVVSTVDGTVLAGDAVVLDGAVEQDTTTGPGVLVAVRRDQARQIAVAGRGGELVGPGSGVTLVLLPPPEGVSRADP